MDANIFDLRALANTLLDNGAEVAVAYEEQRQLPPFHLKNGITIYHDHMDPIVDLLLEIFVAESYTGSDFYRPLEGDSVLDCGANIGVFALYLASRAPGIRVFCFEPCSDTAAKLRMNVERNGLEKQILVFEQAVLDSLTEQPMQLTPSSGDRSFFSRPESLSGRSETIRCMSLANAVELTGVDKINLLKIDAEGSEIEILEGARDFDWNRIDRVALEYHDFFRPRCREISTECLKTYGFELLQVKSVGPVEKQGVLRARRNQSLTLNRQGRELP